MIEGCGLFRGRVRVEEDLSGTMNMMFTRGITVGFAVAKMFGFHA